MMKRVFGLETEYGITVSGAEIVDVVTESIELVRRYTEHGALMKWDYELEDPHLDARGFRARELLQDTDESAYYEIDKNRPLSFEEIKSDLVLSNGAHVLYKVTDFYSPEFERTIAWNDPDLKIDWKLQGEPIVSAKDQRGTLFRDAEKFN